jgi:DNA-binding LacI/PurR family transcriptional regulator
MEMNIKMNVSLPKNSHIPLYYQVYENIKKYLIENNIPEHSRFFPERELYHKFNVDRGTIRRALQMLVDEGLIYKIYREKGRGTFVGKLPRQNSGDFKNIGFIIRNADYRMPFYTSLLTGATLKSENMDCSIILELSSGASISEWTEKNNIHGLIVTGAVSDDTIQLLDKTGKPYIVVGNYNLTNNINNISFDNTKGVTDAIEHIVKNGCASLGLICGERSWQISQQLERSLRCAISKFELPLNDDFMLFSKEERGYDEFKKIMEKKPRPDAVIFTEPCFSGVAQYLLTAKRKENLPKLIMFGQDTKIPLYEELIDIVIHGNAEEAGREALEFIIDIIKKPDNKIIKKILPCEIKIYK